MGVLLEQQKTPNVSDSASQGMLSSVGIIDLTVTTAGAADR